MTRPAAAQFKRGKSREGGDPYDALVLLAATHKAVAAMLRDYARRRKTASTADKGKRALRLCHLLAIHGAIKREIFYPAAQRVLDGKAGDVLAAARVEQATIEGLIDRVESMSARDELFDWTVKALGEHASRQFALEEKELFSQLRRTKFDVHGLGEQMASRQLELSTKPPDRGVFREGKRVMRG